MSLSTIPPLFEANEVMEQWKGRSSCVCKMQSRAKKTNLLERGESIHDEGISLDVVAVKQDLVDVEAMGGDLGFSVVKTKQ
jgi:riboflavin synthase alpha subunit